MRFSFLAHDRENLGVGVIEFFFEFFGKFCAAGLLLLQAKLKHFFWRDRFDVADNIVDGKLRGGNREAYHTHQCDGAVLHNVAALGGKIWCKGTFRV